MLAEAHAVLRDYALTQGVEDHPAALVNWGLCQGGTAKELAELARASVPLGGTGDAWLGLRGPWWSSSRARTYTGLASVSSSNTRLMGEGTYWSRARSRTCVYPTSWSHHRHGQTESRGRYIVMSITP